ncbi:hypothetical protein [Poseidonocella sp. HB161398]|uniref:hypothetical protein n=1 Tax=Poseidonocella sp. HB161398 TaxID=2320855 RepID=UPI001108BC95|nr:hypothetical protein [Poseidonocella sp. HB161398]
METGAAAEVITIDMVRRFLDRLADVLLHGDFDGYAAMIQLPFVVQTRRYRFISTEREDLHKSFDLWQRTIEVNMATALIHRPLRIECFGPDSLMVDYDTDLLCKAQKVLPTFTNWMMLRRRDGVWRVEQVLAGVENAEPSLYLRVDPANPVPQTETYVLDERPKKS